MPFNGIRRVLIWKAFIDSLVFAPYQRMSSVCVSFILCLVQATLAYLTDVKLVFFFNVCVFLRNACDVSNSTHLGFVANKTFT